MKYRKEKMVVSGKTFYPRVSLEPLATYQPPEEINPASLPIGRISTDNITFGQLMRELASEMSAVSAIFPLGYLEVMKNLSLANPDIAQMVDNIVQLGNTGHKVMVEARSEGAETAILDELNRFGTTIFNRYGGVDGFINSALAQIARGGAISVEWVVDESLTGIDKAVFVPLKDIRFSYNKDMGEYLPYQKTNDFSVGNSGLIELNTLTYRYCPMQVLDNSPYAIPPILSALESIVIQRDVVKNLRFISKKMGLLGFVNFLVRAPKQVPGESSDKYISRCQAFLDEQAERLKHNYRDGIAVGFMDSFSVEHHSITGDARGAKDLFEMNEQQVFSGLKADPALHGRTYSTTETYAGVVYEKMLSIITNYQRTVKTVLEYGFKLHLRLVGLDYDDLWIEFEPSQSLNAERDEGTYATKLTNLQLLYNQGIIDQNQFAQEAGYDAPAEPEPRERFSPSVPDVQSESRISFVFNKQSGRYSSMQHRKIIRRLQENSNNNQSAKDLFDKYLHQIIHRYYGDCNCDIHQLKSQKLPISQKKLREFQEFYFAEVYPLIKGASDGALRAVKIYLKDFNFETGDSDLFANEVLETAIKKYRTELADSALMITMLEDLNKIYRYFRLEDTDPFGGEFPVKPTFELIDEKAIEFLRNSDNFYFDRYFSDPKTRESIKKWLTNEYMRSGRNLRDPGELKRFIKRFQGRVDMEDYKILRVVETTTSRARNWGNIFTVQQAEGALIEITGPMDNVACTWCKGMVGKQFKVDAVVRHVIDVMASNPEDLPYLNPFLPGRVDEEMVPNISEDHLLAQGIALPPYHPHCRHGYVVEAFR